MFPKAKEALSPAAVLKAGDHCQFCPALSCCPKIRETALVKAGAAFAADVIPTTQQIAPPKPAILTTDQLCDVAEVSDLISNWATACASELRARIERGEINNRYKIVQGKSSRDWTNAALAADILRHYIDPFKTEMVTPAKAEERLKDANVKKEDRDKLVGSLVTKTFGRSLAPITDKRPALKGEGVPFTVIPQ
jgi:hypothetical protein